MEVGVSYIQSSYLDSYYSNGIDSIDNPIKNCMSFSEKEFYIKYDLDTILYNQGYKLHYRIAAVDKGIIPDTFYTPETGYYKLF